MLVLVRVSVQCRESKARKKTRREAKNSANHRIEDTKIWKTKKEKQKPL